MASAYAFRLPVQLKHHLSNSVLLYISNCIQHETICVQVDGNSHLIKRLSFPSKTKKFMNWKQSWLLAKLGILRALDQDKLPNNVDQLWHKHLNISLGVWTLPANGEVLITTIAPVIVDAACKF